MSNVILCCIVYSAHFIKTILHFIHSTFNAGVQSSTNEANNAHVRLVKRSRKERTTRCTLSVCHSQDVLVRGGSAGADRRGTLKADFVIQGLRLQGE